MCTHVLGAMVLFSVRPKASDHSYWTGQHRHLGMPSAKTVNPPTNRFPEPMQQVGHSCAATHVFSNTSHLCPAGGKDVGLGRHVVTGRRGLTHSVAQLTHTQLLTPSPAPPLKLSPQTLATAPGIHRP